MANRRFGGPQRGGRGFLPNANVNPWQGNTGPATNNLNSSNLQTQLALALSSLLQPQQVNEPPSLLSLNTSPGNYNQDNYSNRLGPRGRSDFRRSEPYNKNQRSGWRNDRSHNRAGPMSRPRNNANKDKNQSASKDKAKADKKSSDKVSNEVSQKSDVKDEKQVDNVDENRDEDGGDTKRDWKEEKNTSDDKKDATDEKEEGGEKEKGDKGKYAGLYNSLFHCFVCNKSMWDADSFKNHIRGRAHIQMMDSLEESFQITVKILRENMRLSEEKKMIEWNRMQRNNRKFHNRNEPESHCNMCDLKFVGKIIAHRKTEGHQRLKRFLHPNCDTCNLEFPSRMEWVEHRFTPEHLFKVKEVLDSKSGDKEGRIVEENLEWENEPLLQENLSTEDENPVLELDDDLANLYNRVPVYTATRPVGKKSLKPIEGFYCEICKRFLRTETDSQNHLKSERHYHEFVIAVKTKFRANVEKAGGDEEGNFKRKKNADGEAEEEEEEKAEEENEDDEEKKKEENGDDMYDPEEACKEGGEEAEEESKEKEPSEKKSEEEPVEDKTEEKNVVEVKTEKTEEEDDDAAAESEAKTVSSPTPRRRGAVKNGAGPKSKKARK